MPLVTRLPDPERIADGEHQIADFETVRIAERDRREDDALRLETQHHEIGLLVLEDDLGGKFSPVGKRHRDLGFPAALNDVIAGDHDPVGGDQHARPERVLDALARDAEPLAEQPPEERIVEERRDHLRDPMAHIDIDHGRRRFLHHRGKGKLERLRALRHRPLCQGFDGQGEQRDAGKQRHSPELGGRFCQEFHCRFLLGNQRALRFL